jgi:hypothetical protein
MENASSVPTWEDLEKVLSKVQVIAPVNLLL